MAVCHQLPASKIGEVVQMWVARLTEFILLLRALKLEDPSHIVHVLGCVVTPCARFSTPFIDSYHLVEQPECRKGGIEGNPPNNMQMSPIFKSYEAGAWP